MVRHESGAAVGIQEGEGTRRAMMALYPVFNQTIPTTKY